MWRSTIDVGSTNPRARIPKSFIWASVCLGAVAVGVAVTHTGIDLFAVAALVVLLFITERTVGDWLGELVGPGVSNVILVGFAVLAGWYMLDGGGRMTTERFFSAAEDHGYSTWLTFSPSPKEHSSVNPVGYEANAVASPHGASAGGAFGPRSSATTGRQLFDSTVPPAPSGSTSLDPEWREAAVTVMVTPEVVSTGGIVVIRVSVRGSDGIGGSVELRVNDRPITRRAVKGVGTVTVQFSPQTPGRYDVSARIAGERPSIHSTGHAFFTVRRR
jgi:hypothetical protein